MGLERTSVYMQKEILKLREQGYSIRTIAASLRVCRKTVRKVLQNQEAGKPVAEVSSHNKRFDVMDWEKMEKEIFVCKTPITVLWEECRELYALDVDYTTFWREVRRRLPKRSSVSLRKIHKPGEKAEVDFCDGLSIYLNGKKKKTQLFAMALPFSSYLFAEFVFTQKIEEFIALHERSFRFFGGVPKYIVCDNLKSGVTKAHIYEPTINLKYKDYADYAGFCPLPARPYKPQDKGSVERQIGVMQQQFLAKKRDVVYASLHHLNHDFKIYLLEFLAS